MKKTVTKRETLAALGFLAPNFLGFFLFVAFPVLFSIAIVATNWSLKPAVELKFVGLRNLWRLVGFRPIEGADPAGGLAWIVAYVGAYGALLGGMIVSLVGLGRKWPGVRLGGAIGLATAVLLIVFAVIGPLGVGSALLGITLLIAVFFFLMDDDATWRGRGALGPALFAAALLAVDLLEGPVRARWEPIDDKFYYYFYNTLYLMMAIPVSIAGSLVLALVLAQPILKASVGNKTLLAGALAAVAVVGGAVFWASGSPDAGVLWATFWLIAALGVGAGVVAFRTLFFLPSFTAGIAIMLLWKQMYNPNFGPINEGLRIVFRALGIDAEPPNWLTSIEWAKPAFMLMGFWISVGGANMLLFLAGLSNIPQDLYEAASIDGASRWQSFWNVTWPQLAPTTFFIVIMSTIGGLQGGFEQARVMTEGGPAGSTKTLAYYVYEKAFMELEFGYASAVAWVLFIIVFAMTAVNWRFGNRHVNY